MPLEKNTVRYIDNFSGGNRGSASAEYFLAQGYAVIFLHRKNSLKPYSRHLLLAADLGDFLNYLEQDEEPAGDKPPRVYVRTDVSSRVSQLLKLHNKAKAQGLLLDETFQSVFEYLWLFRDTIQALHSFGRSAIVYAAAAVSDFYLPPSAMSEHKIQSTGAGLTVHLHPVPKCLSLVSSQWAPEAFLITFKLETDPAMLLPKVTRSFSHGQSLVIGNLLSSYKERVSLFAGSPSLPSSSVIEVVKTPEKELEETLISEIARLHALHRSPSP